MLCVLKHSYRRRYKTVVHKAGFCALECIIVLFRMRLVLAAREVAMDRPLLRSALVWIAEAKTVHGG